MRRLKIAKTIGMSGVEREAIRRRVLEANGAGSTRISDESMSEAEKEGGKGETCERQSEVNFRLDRVDVCRDGDGVRQLSEAEEGL